MAKQKKEKQLNIIEFPDWLTTQTFNSPDAYYRFTSTQKRKFLKNLIYPMFYKGEDLQQFKSGNPFPLVLKDYSASNPTYVIDTTYFTIVFFLHDNYDDEMCWEVSFHIKDHEFCDERLHTFSDWFYTHYIPDRRLYSIDMEEMPKDFLYPKLSNYYSTHYKDFCIEFWNEGRDAMLFKFLDMFRIY